jgi:hypothetical protein
MESERIQLTDDNKYTKFLDEYKHTTLGQYPSKDSYPTIDHTNRYIQDIKINTLDNFDGRDIWSDFLTPLSHTHQSSWNTAVTRTLSSRFSILSIGQIMPKINYTVLMYCPIRDIMVSNEEFADDIFKRSVYYALNYVYVFGAAHVGCFNYKALLDKGYAKFEDFSNLNDMVTRYSSCRDIIGKNHSQCLDNTDARLFRSIFNVNLAPNKETIKWELCKFGPVISVMNVYDDFKYYNGTDIYDGPDDVSDQKIGARCVIIMGWGKDENGKDYWILDPGFGVAWGREGYFYCHMNIDNLEIEKNCVSVYPDFAVFSDYILDFYKDYKIDSKLVDFRNQVKIDPNSFLVKNRKKFIERNYPNIKLDYINDDLLPNYNNFLAKDAEYFVFKTRSKKADVSYLMFIIGSTILILIGIYFFKK